jgi:protein gp37
VSAGCEHCYAERFAERFRGVAGHPYEQGFDLRLWPDRLAIPLRWQRPRRIFVNSMSDLFHASVPDAFIFRVFAVMAAAPRHTFMVLTKRPQRMRRVLTDTDVHAAIEEASYAVAGELGGCHLNLPARLSWPLPNVWLGTSVESQEVTWRIDWLVRTPAMVRFLSCEPLLGPLDLERWLWEEAGPAWAGKNPCPDVGWVIAGGESGPGHRPCNPAWVRGLRDQCIAASCPFFFKQFGGLRPKDGGRLLDGRTWDEFPEVVAA